MPKARTTRPRAQLQQGRTDWYRITNLGTGTAVIYVYDEIGYWGTTAGDLVNELSQLQGVTAIDLHINSPGGEVFEGIAIYNCLRAHPAEITVYVDGIAASIASVIAMAGDRIVMGPHSQMMIHEGSGLCIGDADEMRKMADLLDFQSDNIAGVYAARAGGTVEEWRARMRTETWYTAETAVAAGLADEVAESPAPPEGADDAAPDMAASWDLTLYAKHPPAVEVPALAAPVNVSDGDMGTPPAETPAAGVESLPPEAPAPAAAAAWTGEHGPELVDIPDGAPVSPAAQAAAVLAEPEAVATVPEPEPEWDEIVAHLTNPPAASTADDLLAALREA
jgi:ATP-dependent protease ClpP protease subunit